MSSYFKSMWEKASDLTYKITSISQFNDPSQINQVKTGNELKEFTKKKMANLYCQKTTITKI